MYYKSFEANYLTMLLGALINNQSFPVWSKNVDWEALILLADSHHVSGMLHYAFMTMRDAVPTMWREHCRKQFRRDLDEDSSQEKEIPNVLAAMEANHIGCVVLPAWQMKGLYPQKDMRSMERVELLYQGGKGRQGQVASLLREMGYHYERTDIYGNMFFDMAGRWGLTMRESLFSHNRSFRGYFQRIWERTTLMEGCQYVRELPLDDFYIVLMADLCDSYAFEQAEIRQMADLYLFLKRYREKLNWVYIDSQLGSLNCHKFSKYLEKVSTFWFNKNAQAEEDSGKYLDIEDYIFSKGSFGRETSIALLPMITQLEIDKIKDERREKIKRLVRWFYPETRYMEGLYPVLLKAPWLGPFCRLLRLLRLAYYSLRLKAIKLYHGLFFHVDRLLEAYLNKREEKLRKTLEKEEQLEKELEEIER